MMINNQASCQVCTGEDLRNPLMDKVLNKYGKDSEESMGLKCINDIIYNEPTRLVSIFKDYLVEDDYNEFLYTHLSGEKVKQSLREICDYYEDNTTVFPNYLILG